MQLSQLSSADCIPKPQKRAKWICLRHAQDDSFCLQAQMGLQSDRRGFNRFLLTVRITARKYLCLTRPAAQQNKGDWSKFFTEVAKKLPELTKYEEGWPIESYTRAYLRYKAGQERRLLGSKCETGGPIRQSQGSRQGSNYAAKPHEALLGKQKSIHSDKPSVQPQTLTRLEARASQPPHGHVIIGESLSRRRTASKFTVTASATPLAAHEAPLSENTAIHAITQTTAPPTISSVLDFLNGLQPPQPSLLKLFTSLGITNVAYLDGFAHLLSRDRWLDALVREERVKWMQANVIREGLLRPIAVSIPSSDASAPASDEEAAASSVTPTTCIKQFLRSLRPSLISVLPLFAASGISDWPHLAALARMERRDIYLRQLVADGRLTPLQMQIIAEGLDKVRRDANWRGDQA